jgi:hypothetical protein
MFGVASGEDCGNDTLILVISPLIRFMMPHIESVVYHKMFDGEVKPHMKGLMKLLRTKLWVVERTKSKKCGPQIVPEAIDMEKSGQLSRETMFCVSLTYVIASEA